MDTSAAVGPAGKRYAGRVVIVTGASKGIGAATARAFGAEGGSVVLVDVDRTGCEGVATAIGAAGGAAVAVSGDVRLASTAAEAVRVAEGEFGGLDVLFSNAGINRYGEVPDLAEDDWDAVLDTNLKAPYLMAKHAIPAMRRRGGGAIVNTASVQAFASQLTVPAYAASKGGVVSLTSALALDHAKDRIRVNCIAPGSVRTPMLVEAAETFDPGDPEGRLSEWGRMHPIGILTEPDDVARLVLFLASDEARTITGACYRIDGGLLARLGI